MVYFKVPEGEGGPIPIETYRTTYRTREGDSALKVHMYLHM